MGKKSEDLKYIESCINNIIAKNDIEENLANIERVLQRTFNKSFTLSISTNEVHDFFAVNVFPVTKDLSEICEKICASLELDDYDARNVSDATVLRWKVSSSWNVELDSDMLYDISNKYNATDVVTAMLHEIIRVIYSPTVPLTVYRVFRESATDMGMVVRALFKHKKIQMLLRLAFLECCESKIFTDIKSENACENMQAIHDGLNCLGYMDDYNSLVNRFITNGNMSKFVYRTFDDVKRDIRSIVLWITNIIKELEFNKKRLREALESEQLRSSSDVVKANLKIIYNEFFEGVTDSYRALLSETWNDKPVDKYASLMCYNNIVESCKHIVKEAMVSLFDKQGKLKKVSQLDIDVLNAETGRIETHDDKIYLLDRIYDKLKIVDAGLEYIESGDTRHVVKQTKQQLLDYKKQLEDLRQVVLATRIIEKDYGVFIKYPKGYEG